MKRYQTILLASLVACFLASCGRQPSAPEPKPETGKIQWVGPSKIQPGPIRHESLPEDVVERIKAVQAIFAEVDPTPPEKWIEDFRRDMNPERELVIWEAMARAYTGYTGERNLSLAKRKELFGIILTGSGASTEDALAHLELKQFTKTEAREALELLAKEWKNRESPTRPSTATE